MTTHKKRERNSSDYSRPSHDFRSRQLSSTLFPVILLVTLAAFVLTAHRGSAHRQVVPLITLQSSERVLEDVPFISALAPAASANDKQLYVLRRDTPKVTVYDVEHKRSKDILPFGRAAKLLAISSQGNMYLASDSEIRIIDPTGRSLATFTIPNPTSIAVSANGDVVVNATESGKLLHVYDQTGSRSRSIGELKQFDVGNRAQNAFLNRGKVLVGPSGAFYYVSIFAPAPTVQKFSSEGKLLLEFAIEGNAVDLQLEHAKEFLRSKKIDTVGGFHIITSATIDPATGHLWIGLNGSSTRGSVSTGSGIVYEYDSNGVKLAEYALVLNPPLPTTGVITDLRDIRVTAPWIYVLNSQGEVYRFNMNDKLARQKHHERALNSSPSFWSPVSASSSAQTPSCPSEQPFTCIANCPSGSSPATQDCASEIKKRLTAGDRIISNSCSINPATPGGCSGSATACNSGTGVQVSLSVTLNCNPAPTPTPVSGGGRGCGLTFDGGGSNPCECDPDSPNCVSPILIDVAGNGFQLSSAAGGVDFDIRAEGVAQRISWTTPSSDDAWLALDRNGNGAIDDGSELFGNFTPQPEPPFGEERNGFLALAEYDKPANGGNGDGLITPSDSIFSSLRLWQDRNHNGISEAAELISLQAIGLKTIELDYKEARKEDEYGNYFRYRARVRSEQGTQVSRWTWDVFLVKR